MRLNTSNPGKKREFGRLFASHGIELRATEHDLPEIQADPVLVVVHKASQLEEGVFVEDTSLEVEDAEVGIEVRWLLDHLFEYIGQKATVRSLLARRFGDLIFVYEGVVSGALVSPRGENGFGFDPFFLPDGSTQTLAESKPDSFNARAHAVEAFIADRPYAKMPLIIEWDGPWQQRQRN